MRVKQGSGNLQTQDETNYFMYFFGVITMKNGKILLWDIPLYRY